MVRLNQRKQKELILISDLLKIALHINFMKKLLEKESPVLKKVLNANPLNLKGMPVRCFIKRKRF